jgi:hypothetical protein
MDRETYEAACAVARMGVAKLYAQVLPTPTAAWVALKTDAVMLPFEQRSANLA